MIIEVKGSKSVNADAVESYEHYVLKNQDKRSNVPLFVTAFLTGFALYLKSAFPRLSNSFGESEEGRPPEPSNPTGPSEVARVNAADLPIGPEAQDDHKQKPAGSGEPLFYSVSSRYELDESPAISIQNLNLPNSALVKNFGGISISFQAANDNRWGGGGQQSYQVADNATQGPQADLQYLEDNNGDDEITDEAEDKSNRAPRVNGPVYLADVFGCGVALIGLSDLLRGAVDPDGDALLVKNITVSSGTLTQTAGGWYFDAATLGPVTVTYLISDGTHSVLQTAQFSVLRNPPIIGTEGDDLLVGSVCADDIDGKDGNDNIDSRGGSDTVNAGNGNDHIITGGGNDIVIAGHGDDIVLAGLGDDQIWGGEGNDRLFGDEGNDTIFGENGDDAISGGAGDDLVFAGLGNDIVTGDLGRDTIYGDAGDDRLDGGGGNDNVFGQAGEDVVDGGAGDDFVSGGEGVDVVRGGDGADVVAGDADHVADQYEGGAGIDTLDYSAVLHGTTIDLDQGMASSAEIGTDAISGFEILVSGAGDDEIMGSESDESIFGNAGDDVLAGGAGEDTVSGGTGDDMVTGDLDEAADSYDGGQGMDTLDYSAALMSVVIDVVAANASGAEIGNDSITNFEIITSGEGADQISGSDANEVLSAGGGDDVVHGQDGADTLNGGAGNDVLNDGHGADAVSGGKGDDVVLAAADSADDLYEGDEGFDTLDYSESAQGLLIDLNTGAATGFDIGHDAISGFEKVIGGSGDDSVAVGTSAMVLQGGEGADTFQFRIPEGSSSAEVVHQILDFMVGDRIEMSKYEIFEEVLDTLENRFEEAYGEDANAQPLPIRIRHEGTDDLGQTLIEVDMDRDEHYEMTINLSGHHMLMIVENPSTNGSI